jgi:hypothetical protein
MTADVMHGMVGGLVYGILVALPIAVLAAFPAGRSLIRANEKWTVILGCTWVGMTQPLGVALTRGAAPNAGVWFLFPIMALFGLAVGWGVWKLMEANRPPEPRW